MTEARSTPLQGADEHSCTDVEQQCHMDVTEKLHFTCIPHEDEDEDLPEHGCFSRDLAAQRTPPGTW